jgi:thiol:disulfide interchange protein DsbC
LDDLTMNKLFPAWPTCFFALLALSAALPGPALSVAEEQPKTPAVDPPGFAGMANGVLADPQSAATGDVRRLLKNLDAFKRLPVTGLNLAKAGGHMLLMSDNGRFAVVGSFRLLDVWNGREVRTMADAEDLNRLDLDKIGIKDGDFAMLPYGQGKNVVTVFVDPLCTFCHSLILQMAALQDQYTFHLVMAPVIGEESVRNARKLACEPDRAKALQALIGQKYDGIKEPPGCNLGPLQKTLLATKFFGIDGVPYMILPSTKTYRGGTRDLKGLLENDTKALAASK